jgi:hypothetical protein
MARLSGRSSLARETRRKLLGLSRKSAPEISNYTLSPHVWIRADLWPVQTSTPIQPRWFPGVLAPTPIFTRSPVAKNRGRIRARSGRASAHRRSAAGGRSSVLLR